MQLQKLSVKLFVEQPNAIPLTEFIDVFHGWIQATDGDYHDVADYSHMSAGPGVVLVADNANLSIDEAENRRGLQFKQKRLLSGSNQDRLRAVLGSALENCRKLESEPRLKGKLRFAANEAVIWVNDRLAGTNTDECFREFKSAIEPFVRKVYGAADISFDHDRDPRKRLHVRIKTSASIDLNTLSENLRQN